MHNCEKDAIMEFICGQSAALTVFADQELLCSNAQANRLLPALTDGASMETVFGKPSAELLACRDGKTLMFSLKNGIFDGDVKASDWKGFTLIELIPSDDSASMSVMRSLAESLLEPLTSVVVLNPKLMDLVDFNEDPKRLQWAAQYNRGLYQILRISNHLRLAGETEKNLSLYKKSKDITEWMEALSSKLEPLCSMAGRKLTFELPRQTLMCEIHEDKLERAILNLVSNSIKFTEPGGTIRLSLRLTKSGKICITVADDGCGIPPDEMGTIFRRKQQQILIHDPRAGAGLGLPVARSIVQAHGGKFFLESKQGEGTAVYILLDRMAPKPYLELHSDIRVPDYSGGFDRMLVELSDVLPAEAFDTRDVD